MVERNPEKRIFVLSFENQNRKNTPNTARIFLTPSIASKMSSVIQASNDRIMDPALSDFVQIRKLDGIKYGIDTHYDTAGPYPKHLLCKCTKPH